MKKIFFLILLIGNLFSQVVKADYNYTIFNDSKGMPRCLQENSKNGKVLTFSWAKETSTISRNIYYRVYESKMDCKKIFNSLSKNWLYMDKIVTFTDGHAPKYIEEFSISPHLQLALEQLAKGMNRYIPKDVYENEKFLKSLFEPFQLKNHKQLIRDVGEKITTKLYHAYTKAIKLTDNCSELIGKCEYYLCREKQKNCGAKGYFLGFGYQYCSDSLKRLRDEVSENGKNWLDTTATCLHQQMEEVSNQGSCLDIKKAAIRSHDKCYSEVSFCSLKPIEVVKIFDMIKPALFETGVIIEGVQVLEHCAGF